MLPTLKCLGIICIRQRSRNACSTRPLRGVFSRLITIPVSSEEKEGCGRESKYGSIYRSRPIDEACCRVYIYIVGVRSWPKGSRNRGEKTHAGETGLSRASLAHY